MRRNNGVHKVKVAIDTTFMDRRPAMGTAIVIRHSVQELLRYRDVFDITLIHREAIPEDPLYREFREIIIPKVRAPKFSGFLSEALFFLTTRERFDVYYFSYSRLYPTFWLAPAKRIIFAAMDGGPQTAGYMQKTKGKAPWYVRIFFRRIDAFVALSQFGKRGIIKTYGAPEKKVHVVYNGVDECMKPLTKTQCRPEHLLARYDISDPYILDVSRFDPHKNILSVLRAYGRLIADGTVAHRLVFVGGRHTPSYSALVDAEIEKLGIQDRVRIAPYIETADMVAVYNSATLMVFPSLYEGFGLPVIEAQACGLPVVISDIEALKEVSGGSAEIVDPHDEESICAGMRHLLDDPAKRKSLSENGLKNAGRFTWKAHGDALARIFSEIGRSS
jgi:glycosyltransferase involved in cell wall biosynthesis